jgi:hypothetical protein
LLKIELLYRNDDPSKKISTLLRRGKKLSTITLPNVAVYNAIKAKKLESLSKLLIELSGENWSDDPELTWLQPILSNHYDQNRQHNDEEEEEVQCDCNDDIDESLDIETVILVFDKINAVLYYFLRLLNIPIIMSVNFILYGQT